MRRDSRCRGVVMVATSGQLLGNDITHKALVVVAGWKIMGKFSFGSPVSPCTLNPVQLAWTSKRGRPFQGQCKGCPTSLKWSGWPGTD